MQAKAILIVLGSVLGAASAGCATCESRMDRWVGQPIERATARLGTPIQVSRLHGGYRSHDWSESFFHGASKFVVPASGTPAHERAVGESPRDAQERTIARTTEFALITDENGSIVRWYGECSGQRLPPRGGE